MMKIVEWFVETFFTIKIFLSPTLAGGLIGGYFYLTATTGTQKFIAYGIWTLGIILGILLAWKVKRKQAATEFLGRIIATPDLDKPPVPNEDKTTTGK